CFFIAALWQYLAARRPNREGRSKSRRTAVLEPAIAALWAQFFLAPKLARNEVVKRLEAGHITIRPKRTANPAIEFEELLALLVTNRLLDGTTAQAKHRSDGPAKLTS